jgi:CHRD domain-containing protein
MANILFNAFVATFAAVTFSSFGLTNLIFAQGPPTISVSLSGNEEVPPVQTEATGAAYIIQIGINNYREYSINASNIQDATAGHIHLGAKGENGPVVYTLFKYDTPVNEVSEKGSIIENKFEGPMTGKHMSDLAKAGVEGMLYINIHSEQNPNGELRGQIGSPIIP